MQTVTFKRSLMASLLICVSLTGGLISAQGSPIDYDAFYYNDELYLGISPGRHSANPNQLMFECFGLGPASIDKSAAPSTPFYVVLWEGATLHSCPDGTFPHDHVATEIPGTPGFTPHWRGVLVLPLDPQVLPLTSAAAIEEAEAAGQVLVIDTGIVFNAPVVRRRSGS